MEDKYNRKITEAQIKRLAASKAAPVSSDSDASIRVPRKKKARTGVLPDCKNNGKKIPNHSGDQHY